MHWGNLEIRCECIVEIDTAFDGVSGVHDCGSTPRRVLISELN